MCKMCTSHPHPQCHVFFSQAQGENETFSFQFGVYVSHKQCQCFIASLCSAAALLCLC